MTIFSDVVMSGLLLLHKVVLLYLLCEHTHLAAGEHPHTGTIVDIP